MKKLILLSAILIALFTIENDLSAQKISAKEHGFNWAYWQFDSDFIVYNIEKESWIMPILDALMDQKSK